MTGTIRPAKDFGEVRRRQVGHQIRLARQAKGLGQRAFGSLMTPPISHAAVSYLENGVTHLDIDDLERIATLLDVSLLDLIGVDYSRRHVWGPPNRETDLDAVFLTKEDAMKDHHEHRFTFLRQEVKPTKQWGDRVNERQILDVFFCEACLEYKRVLVRTEEPDRPSFGWREVV